MYGLSVTASAEVEELIVKSYLPPQQPEHTFVGNLTGCNVQAPKFWRNEGKLQSTKNYKHNALQHNHLLDKWQEKAVCTKSMVTCHRNSIFRSWDELISQHSYLMHPIATYQTGCQMRSITSMTSTQQADTSHDFNAAGQMHSMTSMQQGRCIP